jgi:hypothetical protein
MFIERMFFTSSDSLFFPQILDIQKKYKLIHKRFGMLQTSIPIPLSGHYHISCYNYYCSQLLIEELGMHNFILCF